MTCSPLGDAGVAAAALSPPSCSEASERGDEPRDAKAGASGGAAAPNDANAGASGGAAEPSGAPAGPSGVAAGASGTGGGLNHAYPEPTGRAAQGLALYRKRLAELEAVKQAKPDMVAFKELRKQWTPANAHGHISDVPVGVRLNGRGEAAILGLHTAIVSGIMFTTGVPAYAICLSGAYEDDRDDNDDGTIQYTGAGGMEKGKQTKDQENTRGNAALVLSNKCGTPVRVLRGRIVKKNGKDVREYFYDGLYKCTSVRYGPGVDGPNVFKVRRRAHTHTRARAHAHTCTRVHTNADTHAHKCARTRAKFVLTPIKEHAKQKSISVQSRRKALARIGGRKRRATAGATVPVPKMGAKRKRAATRQEMLARYLVCADVSGGAEKVRIPVYNETSDGKGFADLAPSGFCYLKSPTIENASDEALEAIARVPKELPKTAEVAVYNDDDCQACRRLRWYHRDR